MDVDVPRRRLEALLAWIDRPLTDAQEALLTRLARWLSEEALPAGGLGPAEGPRIWTRHLLDALTFAYGWRGLPAPSRLLDVGTGAGLPGLPLAVLFPETEVVLIDRSGRRVDLVRRAARILELPNVAVEQRDLDTIGSEPALVMRAVLPPAEAVPLLGRCLEPGGRAVVGWSRHVRPGLDLVEVPDDVEGVDARIVGIPPEVLDEPSSILIMSRRGT